MSAQGAWRDAPGRSVLTVALLFLLVVAATAFWPPAPAPALRSQVEASPPGSGARSLRCRGLRLRGGGKRAQSQSDEPEDAVSPKRRRDAGEEGGAGRGDDAEDDVDDDYEESLGSDSSRDSRDADHNEYEEDTEGGGSGAEDGRGGGAREGESGEASAGAEDQEDSKVAEENPGGVTRVEGAEGSGDIDPEGVRLALGVVCRSCRALMRACAADSR